MASIIQLIIDAKNNASPALRQIATDVQHLDKAVGTLNKLATLDLGLSGLQAALSTAQQIAQAVSETSQAGAGYERLSQSFSALASEHNTSGASILQAINEVTQGTLSNQTIMQQANNAMLLGVADSAEEFETLAKIAVDRGRAMGISMEYAFESIVKGVGRLSPLILDNLGIVLDADKTYADFAESIGKTADQLSDAEKRMALLERLKAEVSDFDSSSVIDAAASWERLSSSMSNATAAAGDWINKNTPLIETVDVLASRLTMLAGIFSSDVNTKSQGMAEQIREAREEISFYNEELERHQENLKNQKARGDAFSQIFTNSAIENNKALLEELNKMLDEMIVKHNALSSITFTGSDYTSIRPAAEALSDLSGEYEKITDVVVNDYAKAMGISDAAARQSIIAVINMKGSWESAVPALYAAADAAVRAAESIRYANSLISGTLSSVESAALQAYVDSGFNPAVIDSYKVVNAEITAMEQTLANMDSIDAKFYMKQVGEESAATFKGISELANESTKAVGGVGGATKSLTKEFQDLRSVVDGIVSSSLQDIGGADLSKYLPYQDQPGEDARRIASVMVEGWDSEWAEYFKNKFPELFTKYMGDAGGDIQKASALLLKDFQDGLRPELLDKDKIKELAKRMFLADKETSKMVDEIAQELAKELNITIEEARAAVGGAAGIKKKVPSKEEVEKLLGDGSMVPKWKMDGAREKFVEAGKAAGLLDENGYLYVDVLVKPGVDGVIEGDYKLQISSFVFADKTALIDNLQKAIAINLLVTPWLPSTFATDFETNVASKLPKTLALQVLPAALDLERWNKFLTFIEGSVNNVDLTINPTISTTTFESTFAPIRTALAEGFVTQESIDLMVFNLSAGLGLGILQNQDAFTPNGALVAAFMINKFNEMNVGLMMANSLATQLQQAQKTFEAGAANSGKAWGDAFLKVVQANVPMELVRILSELITPQVEQQNSNNRQRGESE